jgi:heme/copper-type cytochrome/quinol oxidase subunit 1
MAGSNAIDIQLHDTMFVFAPEHFYAIPCLLFFIWAGLFVTVDGVSKYQPGRILSIIHVGVTVMMPLLMAVAISTFSGSNSRYYTYANFEGFNLAAEFIALLMLGYIIEQLLFFLYLMFLLLRTGIDKFRNGNG